MQKIASNVNIDNINSFLQFNSESKTADISSNDNSVKFEDLVTSYKKKDETTETKKEEPSSNAESTKKSESKDEKVEVSEKPVEKNETSKNTSIIEKQEVKENSTKTEKSDKNSKKEKSNTKNEVEDATKIAYQLNTNSVDEKNISEKTNTINVKDVKISTDKNNTEVESTDDVTAEEISVDFSNILAAENKTQTLEKESISKEKDNASKSEKIEKKSTSSFENKKIKVTDNRSQNNQLADKKQDSKQKLDIKYEGNDKATITMDLSKQQTENNVLSLSSQTASSDGSNFQSMLNNQIQQNAPEFVKAGNIILKDNDQGTINLVLHPDDLGNIKIHLSMDGKSVSAQISVTTKEALEVFKDNAQTLREAFIESGFNTGDFDVSFSNNSSSQNNDFGEQGNNQNELFAKRAYGNENSNEIENNFIFENQDNFSNNSINIVA